MSRLLGTNPAAAVVMVKSTFEMEVVARFRCRACGIVVEDKRYCINQGLDIEIQIPDGWLVLPGHGLLCARHELVAVDKQ